MKIDCNVTKNFLSEKSRMCDFNKHVCRHCEIGINHNGETITCKEFLNKKPTEAINIVQKWSDSNQIKTILDDFKEKYPGCTIEANGYPSDMKPCALYGRMACTDFIKNECFEDSDGCKNYWDLPVPN